MHQCTFSQLCVYVDMYTPCILWPYVYYALFACIYVFVFIPCECVLGEEASIQVPQSVRQHLVRQASVTAPQGKAAYCGHEP